MTQEQHEAAQATREMIAKAHDAKPPMQGKQKMGSWPRGEVGVMTVVEVREALQQARSAKARCEWDVKYEQDRIARARALIRKQEDIIAETIKDAQEAPAKIERLDDHIAKLEARAAELGEMKLAKPSVKITPLQRDAEIRRLSLIIAKGGPEGAKALVEMQKLLKA